VLLLSGAAVIDLANQAPIGSQRCARPRRRGGGAGWGGAAVSAVAARAGQAAVLAVWEGPAPPTVRPAGPTVQNLSAGAASASGGCSSARFPPFHARPRTVR